MSWDRKKQGAARGYFYLSVRVPGKPHPVKVYLGRGAAGEEAAAAVERRKQARRTAGTTVEAEHAEVGDPDRLVAELTAATTGLIAAWKTATGHYNRRGEWRRARG